ncbi:RNA polymerase sigma factor SigJ [uncultured Roseibium sp.]|uniref:RNA polymerase sigma factor SigJ n=1 Tax=uncultured Roseibium sp. TaxID=1936171 RepID=UPI003217B1B3
MNKLETKTKRFEDARPQLMGLAYRMLGVVADAEDAVQDTFLKWQAADLAGIRNPDAWLVTVCTNRCLDILKSASRTRMSYVGPWIPEPLQTETIALQEEDLDRAQSLTTAFLLLLERLTPKERAAFLLKDIFGKSYDEVARTLGMTEAACRQLVSRASKSVRQDQARFTPSVEQQEAFLAAFQNALATGSADRLEELLAETVSLRSDGGGKATAISRIIEGRHLVGKYIARILGRLMTDVRLERREVNGIGGLVTLDGDTVVTAMTIGYAPDGTVDRIYLIRNPDKLRHLTAPARHDPATGGLRFH